MRRLLVAAAIAGLAAAGLVGCGSDDSDSSAAGPQTTADGSSDYSAVCEGTGISNAKPFEKPYKIMIFDNLNQPDFWGSSLVGATDAPWYVKPTAFEGTNAVVCMSRVDSSMTTDLTCPYENKGKQIDVAMYSADYTLTLRNAQTGEVEKELETVSGKADEDCPSFLAFDLENKRHVAEPDDEDIDKAIRAA